jgi:diguanylate cyclase (GGDEF)-like protein
MPKDPTTELLPVDDITETIVDHGPGWPDASTATYGRRRIDSVRVFALQVIAGPEAMQHVAIFPGDRILIGRDVTCALRLVDTRISRHHVSITCDLDNLHCTVEDLGSLNGTYADGTRLESAAQVKDRMDLALGDVVIRLERITLGQMAHLARQAEKIREASLDDLTNLFSRRMLDDVVPKELKHRHAAGIAVSAVFLDVDHFKSINDQYGHLVGDEVLRRIAQTIESEVRQVDRVFRYGGDEFLLILVACDEAGAAATARRVLHSVRHVDWSDTGADKMEIGLSAGVALFEGGSLDTLLQRADLALLEAKRLGRHQVVMCSSFNASKPQQG